MDFYVLMELSYPHNPTPHLILPSVCQELHISPAHPHDMCCRIAKGRRNKFAIQQRTLFDCSLCALRKSRSLLGSALHFLLQKKALSESWGGGRAIALQRAAKRQPSHYSLRTGVHSLLQLPLGMRQDAPQWAPGIVTPESIVFFQWGGQRLRGGVPESI